MKRILFLILCFPPVLCANVFDEFTELYQKYGQEKYMIQEEITQENHVLQAAYLAKLAGAPEDVTIGLLFHDIGQLAKKENLGKLEILHPHHAEFGAVWLEERGFPEYICDWVKNHALAKIVLCMLNPSYFDYLSTASKISYVYQDEKYKKQRYQYRLNAFLDHPRRDDFLAARKVDDLSKIVNFIPPPFEEYREMTMRVWERKGQPATNPKWRETIDQMHRDMVLDRSVFEAGIIESM